MTERQKKAYDLITERMQQRYQEFGWRDAMPLPSSTSLFVRAHSNFARAVCELHEGNMQRAKTNLADAVNLLSLAMASHTPNEQ